MEIDIKKLLFSNQYLVYIHTYSVHQTGSCKGDLYNGKKKNC